MSDHDRQRAAAVEAIVGGALAVAGLLLIRHLGALLQISGNVLIVFGVVGLGHAVALGLGLVSRRHDDPERS